MSDKSLPIPANVNQILNSQSQSLISSLIPQEAQIYTNNGSQKQRKGGSILQGKNLNVVFDSQNPANNQIQASSPQNNQTLLECLSPGKINIRGFAPGSKVI